MARTSAVLKTRLQNLLKDVCVMTPAGGCKGCRCRCENSTSCAAVQAVVLVYIPLLWLEHTPHVAQLQLRSNERDLVQAGNEVET